MGEMLKNSIADAVSISFETISELAFEMEEQFENAADWAQQSDANHSRFYTGPGAQTLCAGFFAKKNATDRVLVEDRAHEARPARECGELLRSLRRSSFKNAGWRRDRSRNRSKEDH